MSTSKAGPSKVKSKKVAAPEIPALSAETIDSSSDESDNDESSESADSEGDLEDIAPKKKSASRPETKAGHGGSLPKYAPPAGMIPIDMDIAFIGSAFDYDQLEKNPNLELWSIRVPADFKTSRLASLVIDVKNSRKEVKGSLKHKSTTYSLAQASATNGKSGESKEGDSTVKDTTVEALTGTLSNQLSGGAEEMEGGMRLMIPSSRAGGRLQVAPLPVHRHLILTPDVPELSTAGGLSSEDQVPSSFLSVVGQNPTEMMDVPMEGALPAKRKQPAHLLKFRNRAYGFDTPGPNQPETSPKETTMDVDDEITPKKRKTGESTKKKSKK